MRLYFILAFIWKTFMVWPGANNQLDYNTVPDIQKYYLDGSNIILLIIIIIIIIIILLRLLFLLSFFLSFRGPWTCPRQISGTTGQNFMKLGGVIDICF